MMPRTGAPSGGCRSAPACATEPIEPEALERDRPDAHLTIDRTGRLAARCSLWWRHAPPLPGHRVGVVGHYAASSARAGQELLERACQRLAAERCTIAVGPMDGSTWRRYRFVTTRGGEPPFLLEPDNVDRWPDDFLRAGFSTLASYRSSIAADLGAAAADADETAERLHFFGITLRRFDPARPDEELRRLHAVSLSGFSENLLYTPIDASDFCRLYRPLVALVIPDLVTIAEVDGRPVGFVFVLPDLLEPRSARGPAGQTALSGGGPAEACRTVVVKTLAVVPEWRRVGLGRVLFAHAHQRARQLGFRRAIHALMHDGNVSRAMSARIARPFRHYALLARPL